MLCFDPDRFAVTGEPVATRMELPGKPYAPMGLVREVTLSEDDLPYRMVCFSMRDMGLIFDVDGLVLAKRFIRYGWPEPIYTARQPQMHAQGHGLTWHPVMVYTYPEAATLIHHYKTAKRRNPQGVGRKVAPTAAREITVAIAAIREELEAQYD